MNPRRLFLALFLLLFAGLAAGVVLFLIDTREEYLRLRDMKVENLRHLDEVRAQLAEQETILQRLKTDPTYVERVIRAKLGYARPDEEIFRFGQGQ